MKNASAILAMVMVLVACAWSQSESTVHEGSKAKQHYVFRIPVYPETELFKSNPVFADLNPPFATTLEVYATKSGRPLSKESVLAFYRAALSSKGWTEGIFKGQPSEPYLSMRANLFEDSEDGLRIQVAGEFYLWVAPRDGMITVYLKQWRVSSTDQATHNSLEAMVQRLADTASRLGYRAQKVSSDNGWKSDFENEYLVDRTIYILVPHPTKKALLDAPPGTLTVTLLTYRDANVATAERALREQEHKSRERPYSIELKGKTLVTVEGDAPEEKLAAVLTGALSF